MNFPEHKSLPTEKLAACFNNTVATYKYYWFLSILQSVELGVLSIQKKQLFARMVANAWYTINYFHISFGVADKLQRAIENLKVTESLTVDEDRGKVYEVLATTKNSNSLSFLEHFDRQVPHWFLSPWFPGRTKSEIYKASQSYSQKSLYAVTANEIIINSEWLSYLQTNARFLKDFCFWNLSLFLQARNPNVPDIPNKLIKPAARSGLSKQRNQFWDVVLKEVDGVDCIYTGKRLTVGNYAVEHFIPHAFVSHDLIWNLIPADSSFNSSKSNKLPLFEKYFDPFFSLQKQAIEIVKTKTPNSKHLLEYLTIFPDLDEITSLPQNFTKEKFRDRLLPLVTIASNNGFQFMT
ncbi:MAG: HNH endonuclease domain-containing protein [Imperialibacter sp.]|uniref:HNH endonuclease domain-containing protein n=1 Tax=Imperialibacter sp. TaxID=2038411 RepID=UPI003A8C3BA8